MVVQQLMVRILDTTSVNYVCRFLNTALRITAPANHNTSLSHIAQNLTIGGHHINTKDSKFYICKFMPALPVDELWNKLKALRQILLLSLCLRVVFIYVWNCAFGTDFLTNCVSIFSAKLASYHCLDSKVAGVLWYSPSNRPVDHTIYTDSE